MNTLFKILMISGLALLMGCDRENNNTDAITGYIPVYNLNELQIQFTSGGQAISNPGKIYVYDNLLLINELGEGIHIIDNTNSSAPKKLGFYKVNGCYDMAVRNDHLYVDYMMGLAVIDISIPTSPVTKSFIPVKLEDPSIPKFPGALTGDDGAVYFKCVDSEKPVLGWITGKVSAPYCKTY